MLLKFAHLQTSQISLLPFKTLKLHAFASNIHSSKIKRQRNTYNNQMRPRTPLMLKNSKAPTLQDPLRNLKTIKSLGTFFTCLGP